MRAASCAAWPEPRCADPGLGDAGGHDAGRPAGLRGPARRRYEAFLDDLATQGCAAMGYRLTGPDPLPRLCVQHLRAQDRVVVAFPAVDQAWILLVGPHHDDDPGRNVYDLLYQLAGVAPPEQARRTKPPCCDEQTSTPPPIAANELDTLVDSARRLVRQ